MAKNTDSLSQKFAPKLEFLEDRVVPALTIRFDYSFDTTGFFRNHPERQAALNEAGQALASQINDQLAPILPTGVNSWTASVYNSLTRSIVSIPNLAVNANELVIYVAAGSLSSSTLGIASSGAYSATGTQDWLNTVVARGQQGVFSDSDYSTWGGMIVFNSNVSWDFSPATPSGTQFDFHSVAEHELMHIFGFGLDTPSFTRHLVNGAFAGSNVVSVMGGPVAMAPNDPDHFALGTSYQGQESIMTATLPRGEKRSLTELEFASLRDIGWGTNYSLNATPSAPPVLNSTTSYFTPSGVTEWAIGTGGGNTQLNVLGAFGASLYSGTGLSSGLQNGVRVATGDINGDGVKDIIAGSGAGGPSRVEMRDGTNGQVLGGFAPFESGFTGGVYVASADFNGDGRAEIVVGAGEGGGPRVKIFDGATGILLEDFWGIEDINFRGGVRLAAGDVNGDGIADLVVAAGEGGGPRVALFNGASIGRGGDPTKLIGDFSAFDPGLRDGVFVTVVDLNGDGFGEIVTGAGAGGGPRVSAFDGLSLIQNRGLNRLVDFFAGDVNFRAGVRVAAADLDNDGQEELITAPGPGTDGIIRGYKANNILRSGNPNPIYTLSNNDWVVHGAFVG